MVLDFCGGCAVPCSLSLALGWVRFWPAVSTAPVRCEVCSLGCPSWLVLLFMSLLSFTCSCGGMVWSRPRSVAPPAAPVCWAIVGSLLCHLGLWSHPLLLLFLAGFLPLAFVRTWVGRLQSCLGSCLLLGGTSPPLSWLFLLGDSYSVVVQAP